jgi:hypothetical protein
VDHVLPVGDRVQVVTESKVEREELEREDGAKDEYFESESSADVISLLSRCSSESQTLARHPAQKLSNMIVQMAQGKHKRNSKSTKCNQMRKPLLQALFSGCSPFGTLH